MPLSYLPFLIWTIVGYLNPCLQNLLTESACGYPTKDSRNLRFGNYSVSQQVGGIHHQQEEWGRCPFQPQTHLLFNCLLGLISLFAKKIAPLFSLYLIFYLSAV